MPEPKSPFKRVRRGFVQKDLKRVCEMHEKEFGEAYEMDTYIIQERQSDNFYFFKDNGSDILAVAHLDTVMAHERRTANFVSTQAGPVIFSGALDDRLGAYTILELLPKLGLKFDWLLTVGEESGRSTAEYFESPTGKEYNWMIEFDRGGTDVVMYQYDDADLRDLVRKCGARPADGIFSDISYMEHLEIKGLNWGVGYQNYHGPRSHAFLEDYWSMIGHFIKFHDANGDTYLPHDKNKPQWYGAGRGRGSSYGSSSMWGDSDYGVGSGYKSPYGERWWDEDDAVSSTTKNDNDEPYKWWEDEQCWNDEHWDAYLDGGLKAVHLLDPPDGVEDYVEEAVLVTVDDDEMVSDDFSEVNAALNAAQPELAVMVNSEGGETD